MKTVPFYVVNKSTICSDEDAAKMCLACDAQLVQDVAPAWGRTVGAPGTNVLLFKEHDIPKGSSVIALVDDPTDPGALGEHWEAQDGTYKGAIFLKPCVEYGRATAFTGDTSFSSVLSHEVVEAFVDPTTNVWSDANDGYSYILEACDPVEGDSYETANHAGVPLSNFILPAWFDDSPPHGAKFDFLGKLHKGAPSMTSGGYCSRRVASSKVAQITAEKVISNERPMWRDHIKIEVEASKYSRAYKKLT